MAEEYNKSPVNEYESNSGEGAAETTDRGLFDFLGKKKEEKQEEEAVVTEFEKVKVSEEAPHHNKYESSYNKVEEAEKEKVAEEKPHESLLDKLHRSDSSSSSSSDEEEDEEKKKKRKEKKEKKGGLKEKVKEKISGPKEEDTAVPVEKYYGEEEKHRPVDVVVVEEPSEEKKGFLEKIKEKLPGGQHKKVEEEVVPVPAPAPAHDEYSSSTASHEVEGEPAKKGILEKIKEKLPGYHPKADEKEDKEKVVKDY